MKNLSKFNYLLILAPVFIWPVLWSNGLVPSFPQEWFANPSRGWWWSFATSIFILEWLVFFYLRARLKKNSISWKEIGLDVNWFHRNRKWLIPYVSVFLIMSVLAPGLLYGDNIPDAGQIIPITAVTWSERLFFVFVSMTAGICEEITFRGIGLTFFSKVVGNKWIPVIVTSLCFVFIHGPFRNWIWFAQYFSVGALFAIGFLAPKRPRLEILILIHFTVDASLAAFVP